MKRVSINWVFPFWASRIIFLLFIIVVLSIDLYLLPLFNFRLSINHIFIIYSLETVLGSLFVFGQFNRSKYLNQKKLFKFIKLNQLYITQITETKEKKYIETLEMEWIDNKKNTSTFTIRVYNIGGLLSHKVNDLGSKLEAFLGKKLISNEKQLTYTDYTFELIKDERLKVSDLNLEKDRNSTEIQLTKKISYDISKVPHGLTVGTTGSGKSMFLNYKLLQYASMGADIYICDPKNADLSLLRYVSGFPEENVAVTSNQICKILRVVNFQMMNRYDKYFSSQESFGKDFTDFGLKPIVVFIDELTAFVKVSDKKIAEEAMSYIFNLVMMGRQVGILIEVCLQRPDANIIDGAIRDQLGCRVALGNLSEDGYRMVFGSNFKDYKSIEIKGGGHVQIDGEMTLPAYFETPFFDKKFDFLKELEKYY
ncbi:cell division protein FtsK [Streptococcus oralis subsp. oralis]|uniref:FtsK/SpoIIIE domain-containing protein n=1 Tax=Streptococcus oralis TaxID=1303 RepID=UPI0015E5A99E|nr:FtsK/SpoIIIE domain-containing protein [Streptococcus oralis]MBA1351036.1 cell division protein FtsK [Streptococcus oralis subsp. oralis]